jgi:hypothetical protein
MWFRKPWCDRALAIDPPEIRALKMDLQGYPALRAAVSSAVMKRLKESSQSLPEIFPGEIMASLNHLFSKAPYNDLLPDVRARIVSYLLVEGIPLRFDRDRIIALVSDWFKCELKNSSGYSLTDLQRMDIAYRYFIHRSMKLIHHLPWDNAGNGLSPVLVLSGLADTCITLVFSCAVTAVVHSTSMLLLPVPIITAALGISSFFKAVFEENFTAETLQAIQGAQNILAKKLGGQMSVADLEKDWKERFHSVSEDTRIIKSGLLASSVGDILAILETKELSDREQGKFIRKMLVDIGKVNPLHWREVLDCYKIIKTYAIQQRINEGEIASLMTQIRENVRSWKASGEAAQIVNDFVSAGFGARELPEQSAVAP